MLQTRALGHAQVHGLIIHGTVLIYFNIHTQTHSHLCCTASVELCKSSHKSNWVRTDSNILSSKNDYSFLFSVMRAVKLLHVIRLGTVTFE